MASETQAQTSQAQTQTREDRVGQVSDIVRCMVAKRDSYAVAVVDEIMSVGRALAKTIRELTARHQDLAADIEPLAEAIDEALRLFKGSKNVERDGRGRLCYTVTKWDDEYEVCAETLELLALHLIRVTLERLAWEMDQQLKAILNS